MEAYERHWFPRTDKTDLHPLWGARPNTLVNDRKWRKDIPMASDGLCGVDWIEPTHAEGLGVLS